jgi:hypothetical protein
MRFDQYLHTTCDTKESPYTYNSQPSLRSYLHPHVFLPQGLIAVARKCGPAATSNESAPLSIPQHSICRGIFAPLACSNPVTGSGIEHSRDVAAVYLVCSMHDHVVLSQVGAPLNQAVVSANAVGRPASYGTLGLAECRCRSVCTLTAGRV